ncbi:hypothetical protein N7481_007656 [Penicillium waksmanii]|uniref:uncharacterized protein n=1 Tax=Penicillium waksmanii TaxID=69791 RepID=UPI00254936C1|nr:uncharacterized protein N7481_007656 [Penicillium waksmanii]KAJ5980358.1 hypothetical protein N7481_007656 [Penicillium waksmanii]
MATNISYDGPNSGLQVGQNYGHINAQFSQSESSLNQACLRDLRTTSPEDDKDRIEQTNGGLLKDSYRWILDNEQFKQWQDSQSNRLIWIRGDPGKGKTMLLCGIIDELTLSFGYNANISFFFCQVTDVRINNATAVLRGLVYSLVEKQPSLLSHVRSRYDQAGKALFEDINAWNALSKIFTDILKDPTIRDTYLVIDALDECTTDLPFLLELVVQESSAHSHVKWIVSSRNWPSIEERLDTATQTAPISLELNNASVSDAVRTFIRHKVRQLGEVKRYNDKIRDTVYRHLSSNSQGTFLWVALVCQDLNRTSRRHVLKKLKEFPPGLDALYSRMIDQVRKSEDAELFEIPNNLSDDYEALLEIISICGSFLNLRENIIVFVHQSAKEFLLEKAQIEVFQGDKEAEHLAIFSRSLQTMSRTLRRNIFDIKLVGTPVEEFTQPSPNPLAPAKYACVYWVDHLREGWCGEVKDHSLDDGGCLDCFLRQKYLHWLEVLGILGSVSEGIMAMLKLEDFLQTKGTSQVLLDRVQDASRFIRYYRQAIESSLLQVYSSGLVFSPTQSITKICYQKEKPDWILNSPKVDESWSLCLQTLEGHYGWVNLIAWSPDGSRLASASNDKTVRIWDPATGQCASTLEGHTGPVSSIAWSPNGSRLASASGDSTVRIWSPVTSQSISTLEGHTDLIHSIAWSPDGSRLASASHDNTVRTWELITGNYVLTLEGHNKWVSSIAWSPDGSRLASASGDKTVRIWDPATGQCVFTLEGHTDFVNSIAWSPNRSQLASASWDNTIRVWDPVTGQSIFILEGHTGSAHSIAWSPDGSQLASASWDNTIRVWDPVTGQSISTLEGHTGSVHSIAWSPDRSRLASASLDKTVMIWDPASRQCASTLEGHAGLVNSIAWSPDGSRLASASFDKTVRIWDLANSQCTSTLEEHTGSVNLITWSPDGSRLASASLNKTVRIWDPATSQCSSTLEGHTGPVNSIAWSPDGSRLASASSDKTVRIWSPVTSQGVSTLKGHTDIIHSIAWSPDGSRLASASGDKTVRIWSPVTSQGVSTLKGHTDIIHSIAWSPDGSRLASASGDKTVRIWDPATGQCVFTLEGHTGPAHSVAWLPDGSQLASSSWDKTIRIWSPVTGQSVSILEGHTSLVNLIAWSLDGSRLASASLDKTVKIWDPASGQCASTLNIYSPRLLQFDKTTPNHLHTNIAPTV